MSRCAADPQRVRIRQIRCRCQIDQPFASPAVENLEDPVTEIFGVDLVRGPDVMGLRAHAGLEAEVPDIALKPWERMRMDRRGVDQEDHFFILIRAS